MKQTQKELMALIPPEADRVLVETEKGHSKYKPINEVLDTDKIQLNKDGVPIVMKSAPGRKKAPTVGPTNVVVKELLVRKQDAITTDEVVLATQKDPDSPDLLQHIMRALSEEAASIRFDRSEAERNGEDTSSHSLRRINALRALVEVWLKRRDQLGSKEVDLKSPAVRVLIKYLLDTFREAMVATGESEEMIKTVFARASQMMKDESWENDLRNRMKHADR